MTNKKSNYDLIFKLILIGDSSVGKTNILYKFLSDEFDQNTRPTIGVEFATKNFEIENNIIKTQIWDTAGQERYRSITTSYYKGTKGCLLVYDITRKSSFENLDMWINDIKSAGNENLSIILVGNKCDLEDDRKVSKEVAEEKAKLYNIAFMETSALNGTNIEKAFNELINDVYKNNHKLFEKETNLLIDKKKTIDINEKKKEEKGCCCG